MFSAIVLPFLYQRISVCYLPVLLIVDFLLLGCKKKQHSCLPLQASCNCDVLVQKSLFFNNHHTVLRVIL